MVPTSGMKRSLSCLNLLSMEDEENYCEKDTICNSPTLSSRAKEKKKSVKVTPEFGPLFSSSTTVPALDHHPASPTNLESVIPMHMSTCYVEQDNGAKPQVGPATSALGFLSSSKLHDRMQQQKLRRSTNNPMHEESSSIKQAQHFFLETDTTDYNIFPRVTSLFSPVLITDGSCSRGGADEFRAKQFLCPSASLACIIKDMEELNPSSSPGVSPRSSRT
mmetsp:Transcript_33230/g.48798  ORF Transcript_33230/g.48798 Transcript_33230/m.48798 type:complete len:220 (-) Transcript_33230:534-1193(-)|eukprot:CAMPEP_0195519650 /NCGR_PEP_ID=MMETSP0794_2-20130614/15212_1 /TAXON_ID=515487 /ORGANISM="Stephanopyxis turris, Strain CCMP 815" /LENGTH=219 /DNA_ID=CAMNT_0040648841 /DNA_START=99 /DNA_END=758 /DNA_ORIENTATION=+